MHDALPKRTELPDGKTAGDELRILQFNANGCKAAHDLVKQRFLEESIDLGIIQEPYIKNSYGQWIIHNSGTVGMWIKKPENVEEILQDDAGIIGVKIKGITFISVYFSPNNMVLREYENYLERTTALTSARKKVIIGGDLNAKSPRWASPVTNSRTETTENWIDASDLHLANVGNTPTCVRHNGHSFVDITVVTPAMTIEDWHVDDENEPHSDHRHITYRVKLGGPISESSNQGEWANRMLGWILKQEHKEAFEGALKENFQLLDLNAGQDTADAETAVTNYANMVVRTCNDVLTKKRPNKERIAMYWWSEEIKNKREDCCKIRRQLKRAGRSEENMARRNTLHSDLRAAKKELRAAIARSKQAKWEELMKELEANPYSKGYKIAMGKLEGKKPAPALTNPDAVINELFPRDENKWENEALGTNENEEDGDPIPFAPEELDRAMARIRRRKSPGPDLISGEIVKSCYNADPCRLLDLFNKCLEERVFPTEWKKGRLVLIPKPNSEKFRPLTMLPVIGKVYENLINGRIRDELEQRNYLSRSQYGFRRGKSTNDALAALKAAILRARAKKSFGVVISLDIKNAFNTVKWSSILEKLRKAGVSRYLRELIRHYGAGRTVVYITEEGERSYSINRGVPQGSVLGPTLWNIAFNDVLTCWTGEGVLILGFADDTLAVITGKHPWLVADTANEVLNNIKYETEHIGCEFAAQKTMGIIIRPTTNSDVPEVYLDGIQVEIRECIKYLGVMMDGKCKFDHHIAYLIKKADNIKRKLNYILRNKSGPSEAKRRLYSTILMQVMLYAAPVWATNLSATQREALNKAQRTMNIRQVQGYITIGQETASTLSGNPPADLVAEQYVRIWNRTSENEGMDKAVKANIKKQEREITEQRWEERWQKKNNWTKQICNSVVDLNKKYYRATFYTTQLLSGKGPFATYRKQLKKAETDQCWYCDKTDDAAHTLFECRQWEDEREKMKTVMPNFGLNGSLVKDLTASKETWKAFTKMAENIMGSKEAEERKIEQAEANRRREARRRQCTVM